MRTIPIDDFDDWRTVARGLIASNAPPAEIQLVENDGQQSLFATGADNCAKDTNTSSFRVPREFISLAKTIGYHRNANRWNLLYRTLWRLKNEQSHLLEIETDADVHRLSTMEKQVRRDAHKMKAFVRFRKVEREGKVFFVAWYQPDHRIVRRVAPFFSRRFAGMNWTILTPDESVTWNQQTLQYGSGVTRSEAPDSDELEDLWRTYYAHIFNPARVKVKMMKSEMPVRFWKNLPEADIIADLLADAPRRVDEMIEQHEGFEQTAVDFIPSVGDQKITLDMLKEIATECMACDLHQKATQTVFGVGPANAKIVLLGEQPGDQEDIVGTPFIGPAGKILDEAFSAAGLDRENLYVTNTVKHFKHTVSTDSTAKGKRRLHQKPNSREIRCCRPWFDAEWSCLEDAKVLVCLGVTAMTAIMGPGRKLADTRGRFVETDYCNRTLVTWHPSAILRSHNELAREEKMQQLILDLRVASAGC